MCVRVTLTLTTSTLPLLSPTHRYRLTLKHEDAALAAKFPSLDMDDTSALSLCKVSANTRLVWKDLGPQIGYRTVFYLEYLGPMLFVALYATCPTALWGAGAQPAGSPLFDLAAPSRMHWVAQWGLWAWMLHFLKREFETAFVHKFSRPTMPLSNLYKNCTYYWSFGAIIGWPLCSPNYAAPSETAAYAGAALFALAELGNLAIHLKLSGMRKVEGSTKRDVPTGFGFDLVACPNYTFEVLSWVGFSVMTGLPAAWAFTALGFYQMQEWAQKKHREYKKTHGKEYTSLDRKAIVPFVY
eukprot:GSChrysophyteH2.ASY1.ANO1.757.1 assembled CDS